MKPLEELASIAHFLPIEALEDVNQRVGDWLASGGHEDDPYIVQQLRFAKRFVPKCAVCHQEAGTLKLDDGRWECETCAQSMNDIAP